MKQIFIYSVLFSLFCFNAPSFAAPLVSHCEQAAPDYTQEFCSSFKSVAECHCVESGLPRSMCKDINSIYNRMVSIFGTVERACQYQHDTSTQACIDDWNCFRTGNKDSQGKLCNVTGKSCQ